MAPSVDGHSVKSPPVKREGLARVASPACRVLVLGSMPSERSLATGEYYANPRNRFWRVMEALCPLKADAAYAARIAALQSAGVGLWDVIRACERRGSLDANIRHAQANDFATVLDALPSLAAIALNGRTACSLWTRHVTPTLRPSHRALPTLSLPSTSPANAAKPLAILIDIWKTALAPFLP